MKQLFPVLTIFLSQNNRNRSSGFESSLDQLSLYQTTVMTKENQTFFLIR